MPWEYDRRSRTYREDGTGQVVGPRRMVQLRDLFTQRLKERTSSLAEQVTSGAIGPGEWEARMRGLTKLAHLDLAVAARGGRSAMQPSDWGRVGREIRRQYQYLGGFANDLDRLTPGQVAARSGLYMASATVSFERAAAAAAGQPDLPEYPGDGSQQCGANCRCSWQLESTSDGWEATWVANDDNGTCEDCARNADLWSPLFVDAMAPEMPPLPEDLAALGGEVA